MMRIVRKFLAFLTAAFALMMLTVVILEQHNPTMGFFTGTTFRVYQPIFCVLSILVSILLMVGNAPEESEPPARRERMPQSVPAEPRWESVPARSRRKRPPERMDEEYDDLADYPETGPYEEEPYDDGCDDGYGDGYDDGYGYDDAGPLPEDYDWDDYLK